MEDRDEDGKLPIRCHECSLEKRVKPTSKGNPRPPRGWKRRADDLFCSQCWRKMYKLRAITLPVAEPIGLKEKDFYDRLNRGFSQATEVANFCINEYWGADVKRSSDMEKLLPWKQPPLYHLLCERFAKGEYGRGFLSDIEHQMSGKYRHQRYDVIWTCRQSLPVARYPQPYSVRTQEWKLQEKDGRPVVRAPVAGLTLTFYLSRKGMGRQLASLKSILDGDAVQGPLAIYRNRKGKLMCKIVADLPRTEGDRSRTGAMILKTGGDSFLNATVEGREKPWILYADRLKGLIVEHDAWLERARNDLKYEKRWPKASRERFNERVAAKCAHSQRRLDTFIKQSAVMVAKFACRQSVGLVKYDDSDKGYLTHFPWAQLKQRLEVVIADEHGIVFEAIDSDEKKSKKKSTASAKPEATKAPKR